MIRLLKLYTHILIAIFVCCALANSAYANPDYVRGNQLYQHGEGQTTDFPLALKAFKLAGEVNHPAAQFYIGRMYHFGHGTATNLTEAAHWYLLAGKNGQARAWSNLGRIYKTEGFENYDPAKTIKCFEHASNMGMAVASRNLALVYHYGKHDTPKDYQKAETLYLLALQQDPNYLRPLFNLGSIYESGGYGIKANLEAAQRAYTKAAELGHVKAMSYLGWIYMSGLYGTVNQELALHYFEAAAAEGDAYAQNALAILLTNMDLENENSPRVLELLAAAAEQGDTYAIRNYGMRIVDGDVPGVPIEEGVALLKKAAKREYPGAIITLSELATKAEFQHCFTDKEIQHWKAKKTEVEQLAQANAKRILEAANPAIEQGRYDEALALITAEHHKNAPKEIFRHDVNRAIFDEAQTISGRADPEWGWRLFSWVKGIYDREEPNMDRRILACYYIANSLIECGRVAQMRQVSQEAEALILSMHGLQLMPPEGLELSANYTFPTNAYTTHYSAEMLDPILNHPNSDTGDWVLYAPMKASLICAREQLTRANWRETFFITGQVEHWAREVLASDTLPKHTSRRGMLSNLSEALLIKAEAYEFLGLPKEALDCYSEIIDEDMRSYLGRDIHEAITRQARLLTQLGNAIEVDLEQLRATIPKRRDNKFENRDAYQFTQLALAHATHQQGNRDEALALLSRILESTKASPYTFLRIEALRVHIRCALADGRTEGIENALIEIIELARSKGLKNLEPTLYELYAQHLAQADQLQAAQRIQQKAIDLMQGLQMQAQLVPAFAALNELRKNSQIHPTRDGTHFDLQPIRITSAPLPGQGSIAVFSLSNLENLEHDFQLSLNGQAINIFIPSGSTSIQTEQVQTNELQALEFHLLPANSDQDATLQTQSTLSSNEQLLIEIHAPATIFEEGDKQINIRARTGSEEQQVELILTANAGTADIAVINAIELIDNPYYLVPAFHSISSMLENEQSVELRAIASQPTRVEAYNTNNELLFIDAEGNGNFNDPGDLINCQLAADLSPIIQLDTNTIQVEFRYQPHSNTDERVDIQIQTRQSSDDWDTQVIDWIQPHD